MKNKIQFKDLIGKDEADIERLFNFNYNIDLNFNFKNKKYEQIDIVNCFFNIFLNQQFITLKKVDDIITEIQIYTENEYIENLMLLENNKGLFYYDEDSLEIGDGISYSFLNNDYLVTVKKGYLCVSFNEKNLERVRGIISKYKNENTN